MSSITKTEASPVPFAQPNKVVKAIKWLKEIFSKAVKEDVTSPSTDQLEVLSIQEPRSAPPRRVRVRPKRIERQVERVRSSPTDTFAAHALSPKIMYALSQTQIDPEKTKHWHADALSPKFLPAFTKA
jgi:hypothetical protein